ncbi:hypothetical protein L486_04925 [Kwoniella mangroviensis CBS 10435]|uniref:Uncharacterized protein n=1 Tax=Kwoniella mangroviensis CBS 10435 TaxID=1331196 RepID=A0A1B9IPN3_9TREE|nr:hypothetical protein L486_04925 [Kwoniella mangroviensis CBS 10435]
MSLTSPHPTYLPISHSPTHEINGEEEEQGRGREKSSPTGNGGGGVERRPTGVRKEYTVAFVPCSENPCNVEEGQRISCFFFGGRMNNSVEWFIVTFTAL